MNKIKHYHFEQLIKKGYSLDIIYILKLLKGTSDITEMCKGSKKINAIYMSVIRKGLYSEVTKKLTVEGDNLLAFLETQEPILVKKKVLKEDDFDSWWAVFPSTNKFTHNGASFGVSRSFKAKKEDCRQLFKKLVNEKKFTANEIIKATEYDVLMKKNESVKSRQNRLTFLQNSHTYLLQEAFQGFVELIGEKQNFSSGRTSGGSTDI
jgi:hypothetical protein